jgi:hypothetical protein
MCPWIPSEIKTATARSTEGNTTSVIARVSRQRHAGPAGTPKKASLNTLSVWLSISRIDPARIAHGALRDSLKPELKSVYKLSDWPCVS